MSKPAARCASITSLPKVGRFVNPSPDWGQDPAYVPEGHILPDPSPGLYPLLPLPQPLHRPFMPAFQILQLLGQLFDPLLEFATHIRIVGIGD